MNQEFKTIKALLTHIICAKENGWLAARFFDEFGGEFKATGMLLHPKVQQEYVLVGNWVKHDKFGMQFKFNRYEFCEPKNENAIACYLEKYVRGVGPWLAEALVNTFGSETLEVLRSKPEVAIQSVSKFSPGLAVDVQDQLKKLFEEESLLVELEFIFRGLGLPKKTAWNLVQKHHSNALTRLKEDPYATLIAFRGIGFPSADKVAMQRLGIERGSRKRIIAAFQYLLSENEQNGNSWMKESDLITLTTHLIQLQLAGTDIPKDKLVWEEGWVAISSTHFDEQLNDSTYNRYIKRNKANKASRTCDTTLDYFMEATDGNSRTSA
jgi:exodeoxyribonuclease V alpha subunit